MEQQQGVVLALGAGGARGLAHIGVLEVLEQQEIPVRAIVGTSSGAEVGAFYAAGVTVEAMKQLASDWNWLDTMRLFTPDFSEGALSTGREMRRFLEPYMQGFDIETLNIGYAAVAADLNSGEEVILSQGSLLEAVRASMSFPGLLSPHRYDGRLLVDGGLVNPVPFDVARKMFGGPVIAISVNSRPALLSADKRNVSEWDARLQELLGTSWSKRWPQVGEWLQGFLDSRNDHQKVLRSMGLSSVLTRSQAISENMLTKLRMQLSPPDLLIKPDVQHISLLEFYRGSEAIEAGRTAALDSIEAIRETMHPER